MIVVKRDEDEMNLGSETSYELCPNFGPQLCLNSNELKTKGILFPFRCVMNVKYKFWPEVNTYQPLLMSLKI